MKNANFKLQMSKFLKSFFVIFHFAICILQFAILIVGCASAKGQIVLTPLSSQSPEYSVSGKSAVFSNKDIKISILPLNSSEIKERLLSKDAANPLSEFLSAPQYLAFLMDIENSSKVKVLYNPALTALFDNNMGLRKPMDYTDMYSLVSNSSNPESVINTMKDMFYDLGITLGPDQRTSRLLIFSGIEEGSREFTIEMKEIYIGTSTIAVSFGFRVTEEDNRKDKK